MALKKTLVRADATPAIPAQPETATQFFTQNEVFFCPEESHFYSHCLELLVFKNCGAEEQVVEFGCGDGSPVINALVRSRFDSVIHGYELNSTACLVARSRIEQTQIAHKYVIHNQSFFDSTRPSAEYLIANPPYLPAPDSDLYMPLLHGGTDGAGITRQLLSLGYNQAMLMISSYSNPVDTIGYAIAQGYCVADFMILPLQFGYYSSEPKVEMSITELRKYYKAFYSNNIYFLAGVLFKQQCSEVMDLSNELLKVMTSL